MSDRSDLQLTALQKDSVKRARQAAEKKNYDYAITLLIQTVKDVPGYLEARQLLRDIAIRKAGPGKSAFNLSGLTSAPALMKAQSALRKSPEEALGLAEEVLKTDPFNKGANEVIHQGALALGLHEVAAFALETIVQGDPKDAKTLHTLGKLYLEMRDPRAKQAYKRLLDAAPTDGDAISGYKNAEALLSMVEGRWDQTSDYRQLIRDKDQAAKLEAESKMTKSESDIDALIAEKYQEHEAQPDNLVIIQKLAKLYQQKGDLDSSLQWLEFAFSKSSSDSGLEKAIYDLKLKQIDVYIKQCEDYIRAHPEGDPARLETEATLAQWNQARQDHIVNGCRIRVSKYPNDLEAKFELGEALFKSGDIAGAIPELQAALRQPSIRTRAMLLLALCFKAKGQLAIAAKRLEEAQAEILAMDETKKDIIYQLGLLYDEMGEKAKALQAFSQIYEIDYGYRDVAQRVESAAS